MHPSGTEELVDFGITSKISEFDILDALDDILEAEGGERTHVQLVECLIHAGIDIRGLLAQGGSGADRQRNMRRYRISWSVARMLTGKQVGAGDNALVQVPDVLYTVVSHRCIPGRHNRWLGRRELPETCHQLEE